MENHILAGHHGLEFPLQSHLDGGGHLEPQETGGHGGGHVGGADAGGEGAQRSVGAGVGVGPHNDLPGGAQALLGQEGVLHPHMAHIEEVGNIVFVGKVPGLQTQLSGLDVLAGGVVVQDNGDLVLVKDLGETCFLKFCDRHGGGDVVAQHHIHFGLDELPHLHMVQSGVFGQNLLRHCHSHALNYLLRRNGSVFSPV